MTKYLVVRLNSDVILFHSPSEKYSRGHISRIHKISDYRFAGFIDSVRDDLDIITGNTVNDVALFKRTGVDVRKMQCHQN